MLAPEVEQPLAQHARVRLIGQLRLEAVDLFPEFLHLRNEGVQIFSWTLIVFVLIPDPNQGHHHGKCTAHHTTTPPITHQQHADEEVPYAGSAVGDDVAGFLQEAEGVVDFHSGRLGAPAPEIVPGM